VTVVTILADRLAVGISNIASQERPTNAMAYGEPVETVVAFVDFTVCVGVAK